MRSARESRNRRGPAHGRGGGGLSSCGVTSSTAALVSAAFLVARTAATELEAS
jgi:hypothetical protein